MTSLFNMSDDTEDLLDFATRHWNYNTVSTRDSTGRLHIHRNGRVADSHLGMSFRISESDLHSMIPYQNHENS